MPRKEVQIKESTGWGGDMSAFHVGLPNVSNTPSCLELRLEKSSARMLGWEYKIKEIS